MGIRDTLRRAGDAVESASMTVSIGAAVSVAALIIATVAFVVAVVRR